MKPRPRLPALRCAVRKTVKWGGLALTLLIAGLWVRSEFAWEGWRTGEWSLAYDTGALSVQRWSGSSGRDGWFSQDSSWDIPRLMWYRLSRFPPDVSLSLSLWIPFSLALLATAAAWRLDALARRRARAGLCPKCRYDRAGLAAGAVCPECGAPA